MEVPIEMIKPSPYQPRIIFDVEDLKSEIESVGLLRSLLVRKRDGFYELIDGQRRLKALKELGWKTVPVETQDVDDRRARLIVYKLNTVRENYTTEENARYFKKLADEGMTFYQIGKELNIDDNWVLAHINVFKFPEDVQNAIWAGALSVSHIQELEPIIGANIEDAITIARESIARKMTRDALRKALQPRIEAIEKARIEAAKKAIGVRTPIPEVKLETPDDLEKAAELLRKEAERLKTPEQKAEEKRQKLITQARKSLNATKKKIDSASKIVDVSGFRERSIELEKSLEQNPTEVREQLIALGKEVTEVKKQRQREIEEEKRKKREEEERRRLEEEMRRRLEEEKRRLKEEAEAKAKEELLKDRELIREFLAKEFPLMHETLGIDDLRELIMQKLMVNIPKERRRRAENIFNEEWRSLQKRILVFPEKSARMKPKFDRLRELQRLGVFLTTLWGIEERADYAGRGDFHGNCPPQVVENCVLRLTKKGELVVDPMAGSGTAIDVCSLLSRKYIAYDIKPPKWRKDIIRNDSQKIPLENDTVDMVFLHPPYWDMVYYTSADEGLLDLSRAKTLDEYLRMLGQVLRECYRILKNGRHLCILLGDRIKDGRFIPLCRKAANLAEEIGFTDCGYAVKFTEGEQSFIVKGENVLAELAYTENLKVNHDLVMFFKKMIKN